MWENVANKDFIWCYLKLNKNLENQIQRSSTYILLLHSCLIIVPSQCRSQFFILLFNVLTIKLRYHGHLWPTSSTLSYSKFQNFTSLIIYALCWTWITTHETQIYHFVFKILLQHLHLCCEKMSQSASKPHFEQVFSYIILMAEHYSFTLLFWHNKPTCNKKFVPW